MGSLSGLEDIARKLKVTEILLAIPDEGSDFMESYRQRCLEFNLVCREVRVHSQLSITETDPSTERVTPFFQ